MLFSFCLFSLNLLMCLLSTWNVWEYRDLPCHNSWIKISCFASLPLGNLLTGPTGLLDSVLCYVIYCEFLSVSIHVCVWLKQPVSLPAGPVLWNATKLAHLCKHSVQGCLAQPRPQTTSLQGELWKAPYCRTAGIVRNQNKTNTGIVCQTYCI